MTRKHYQAIADVLSAERSVSGGNPNVTVALDNVTRSIADVMAQDNPRFDRSRFYAAAGLGKAS